MQAIIARVTTRVSLCSHCHDCSGGRVVVLALDVVGVKCCAFQEGHEGEATGGAEAKGD